MPLSRRRYPVVASGPVRALGLIVLLTVVLAACGDDTTAPPATPTSDATPTVTEAETGAQIDDPLTADEATDPWLAVLEPGVQRLTVEIQRTIPHDPAAFTQGLEMNDGVLLESTGRRGQSTLRRVDPATGEVLATVALDDTLFGEGLTVSGSEIVQLTWQSGVALRYDTATLEPRGTWTYDGEGWGLCAASDGLWMSDGSSTLTRRDPGDFSARHTVEVTRDAAAVTQLNELECVQGLILANVLRSGEIMVIDPATGVVEAVIDASSVVELEGPTEAAHVLNGIALVHGDRLVLGGKNWAAHYEVRIVAG